MRRIARREFLRLTAMAGTASLVTACLPEQRSGPQPTGGAPQGAASPSAAPEMAGKFQLDRLEGAEVILDPARFPRSFKEAPELAALVQQGKLPPVAERIGQDPLVIEPVHEIGRYGGKLRKSFLGGSNTEGTSFRFAAGPDSLLYRDYQATKIIPNIARGFEQSSDGKTLTIQLRRGMRWSDGAPFTADDIMFWFEDVYGNKEIMPRPTASMLVGGKPVVIEKVDEFTVRFVSPAANYLLPELLVSGGDISGMWNGSNRGLGLFAPKHYLSKFHPKYAGQAEADRLATEAKFNSWVFFFKARNDPLLNPDLPVVSPWRTTIPPTNPSTFLMERNPYSIWVDTEGNQLPYVGTIEHTLASDLEVVALRAIAGDYDFQDRSLEVSKLPVLIEGQARGGYKIHLDPSQSGLGIALNLAYNDDPEIGEWIRNVDFRRALSLGIERDQINETFFLGTGTPGSAAPAEDNKFSSGAKWSTKWATFDVAQANQLLDKIGLTQKDAEGYRLRKDGKGRLRLDFLAVNRLADFPAVAEMLKQHWAKIGIDLAVETVANPIAIARINANQALMVGNNVGTDDVFLASDTVVPGGRGFSAVMGVPYARWFATGGKEGTEPFPAVKQAMELLRKGFTVPEAERLEIGKEIMRIHVDNVFSIGLVGRNLSDYGLRLAKTNVGNMPGRIINSTVLRPSLNAHPMTFYFK